MGKKALIAVNLAGFLTFLWNDIKTLQNMGYEVSVAMNGLMKDGSPAVEIEKLDKMGIKHYQINFDTKSPFSKDNINAYKELGNLMKQGFDLVHCHTPIVGFLTRLAASKYRRKGTKVIYTTHGFTFTDRTSKKVWLVFYNMEKFASRFCDAIITINHEDFRNAKKMHCKKTFIIPGVGLDNSRFRNVNIDREKYREKLGVGPNDIMILGVGELSDRKNHQIIIKALGKLNNKNKYVFVICGRAVVNSGMEDYLRELADNNKVRLVLAGHRADIPEMNLCADIAVIPSLREGLGMAGLEALASGIPVIGSDVQGIREYVVNNETGYLCSPLSEDEFANAIEHFSVLSYEEKKQISDNCKAMAEKFDVKSSKSAMKSIYKEILTDVKRNEK